MASLIPARPGQAEPAVEPGVGVVGDLGREAAERLRGRGQLAVVPVPQAPGPTASAAPRHAACGSDRPCARPGAGRGPIERLERLAGRRRIGIEPERPLPGPPGRQRPLGHQVVPALVDQGQRRVGRSGRSHVPSFPSRDGPFDLRSVAYWPGQDDSRFLARGRARRHPSRGSRSPTPSPWRPTRASRSLPSSPRPRGSPRTW